MHSVQISVIFLSSAKRPKKKNRQIMEVAATSPSERLYPSSSGSSGDETERIMMTKSGLSHNDYYQTAEEVSLLNVITILLKLVQKEIIYL